MICNAVGEMISSSSAMGVYSTVTYFNPLKLYITVECSWMSKVIRVRYENEVLKPPRTSRVRGGRGSIGYCKARYKEDTREV